jgi:hypothetical protein
MSGLEELKKIHAFEIPPDHNQQELVDELGTTEFADYNALLDWVKDHSVGVGMCLDVGPEIFRKLAQLYRSSKGLSNRACRFVLGEFVFRKSEFGEEPNEEPIFPDTDRVEPRDNAVNAPEKKGSPYVKVADRVEKPTVEIKRNELDTHSVTITINLNIQL